MYHQTGCGRLPLPRGPSGQFAKFWASLDAEERDRFNRILERTLATAEAAAPPWRWALMQQRRRRRGSRLRTIDGGQQ
jgi:hypothetical protein